MKRFALLLAFLVATCLPGFGKAPFKVLRTMSDRQIRTVERQVLRQYGIKVDIQVISRNDRKEITNLHFLRYNKAGKRGGSCSSDKFGALLITPEGCSIADFGYEKDILAQ